MHTPLPRSRPRRSTPSPPRKPSKGQPKTSGSSWGENLSDRSRSPPPTVTHEEIVKRKYLLSSDRTPIVCVEHIDSSARHNNDGFQLHPPQATSAVPTRTRPTQSEAPKLLRAELALKAALDLVNSMPRMQPQSAGGQAKGRARVKALTGPKAERGKRKSLSRGESPVPVAAVPGKCPAYSFPFPASQASPVAC